MKISCGIYLFNSEDKLLIAHPTNHGPNVWSIPKGRIDDGETSEYEVAVRELWEETNINLKNFSSKLESVVPFDYVRYRNTNKYLRGFFVKVNDTFIGHELKCHSWVYRDGKAVFHEMDDFKWVSLDEARPVLNEFQNINIELCQDLIKKK